MGSDTCQYIKALILVFIMSKEVYNLREKDMKEKCEKCKSAIVKAWFKGVGVCIKCYNNEKGKWCKDDGNSCDYRTTYQSNTCVACCPGSDCIFGDCIDNVCTFDF